MDLPGTDGRSLHGLLITMVIVNLFAAVPFVGEELSIWIRGDFVISDATLNRFFAFHVIALPLVLLGLVVAHILALHEVGSNNPDGVEIKKNKDENGIPKDGIPFHPYYTVKDIVGVIVFLMFFFAIVFFAPEMGGYFIEGPNFEPADPLKTPEHIAPVWYFTPFYAILRAVPDKLLGVGLMFAAIGLLFFMPWLDRCKVKSWRYRSNIFRTNLIVFCISFLVLGWLAMQHVTPTITLMSQVFTVLYFGFFVVLYVTSKDEKTKPVPDRVTG